MAWGLTQAVPQARPPQAPAQDEFAARHAARDAFPSPPRKSAPRQPPSSREPSAAMSLSTSAILPINRSVRSHDNAVVQAGPLNRYISFQDVFLCSLQVSRQWITIASASCRLHHNNIALDNRAPRSFARRRQRGLLTFADDRDRNWSCAPSHRIRQTAGSRPDQTGPNRRLPARGA